MGEAVLGRLHIPGVPGTVSVVSIDGWKTMFLVGDEVEFTKSLLGQSSGRYTYVVKGFHSEAITVQLQGANTKYTLSWTDADKLGIRHVQKGGYMTTMQLGDPVTHRRHPDWTGAVARSPQLDGSRSYYGKPFLRLDSPSGKVGQEEMDSETAQVFVSWTHQDRDDPEGALNGGRWYILSAITPRNTAFKVTMTLDVVVMVPGSSKEDAINLAQGIVVGGLNEIEGIYASARETVSAYVADDHPLPED